MKLTSLLATQTSCSCGRLVNKMLWLWREYGQADARSTELSIKWPQPRHACTPPHGMSWTSSALWSHDGVNTSTDYMLKSKRPLKLKSSMSDQLATARWIVISHPSERVGGMGSVGKSPEVGYRFVYYTRCVHHKTLRRPFNIQYGRRAASMIRM